MQALSELTVVDIGGSVATGYCAKLFADYGAEVINLEPQDGFATRRLAPLAPDAPTLEASAMHAYLSARKRSVCRDGLSADRLAQIVSTADIVLDDGRVDDLAHQVQGLRCSISWYGLNGPYADFTGTDAQCFALNGMLRIIGREQGPPLIPTGYQAQIMGGVSAYVAVLGHQLGLELGNLDGPQHIDVSVLESCMCFTDVAPISMYNTGLQAHRIGINRLPPTYPLGVFPCRDGWIGLTVLTPGQWHAFCELLDMNEFAHVPLFQVAGERGMAADILEPVFREKLLNFSAEELFYRGQEARIALARVPTMEELFEVDQFVERNAFTQIKTTHFDVQAPSVPFRLLAAPPLMGGEVAELGQHTAEFAS